MNKIEANNLRLAERQLDPWLQNKYYCLLLFVTNIIFLYYDYLCYNRDKMHDLQYKRQFYNINGGGGTSISFIKS